MKSGSLRHPWLSLTDTFQNNYSFTEMGIGVFGEFTIKQTSLSFLNKTKTQNQYYYPLTYQRALSLRVQTLK